MLALGTPLPDYRLTEVRTGKEVGPADFPDAPAVLVMFLCTHCPFVRHVAPELARLSADYAPRGVAILGACSNDAERHPDDGPEGMREAAAAAGWDFPYVFDATQAVARAFQAACTPDFFLFDRTRRLAYRGQLDSSRPGNDVRSDGRDLRAALEAVLGGREPAAEQRPSIGCSIKWRPGQEPPWFPAS
jgi:thiol-disulfide isomerase/thioredoxin